MSISGFDPSSLYDSYMEQAGQGINDIVGTAGSSAIPAIAAVNPWLSGALGVAGFGARLYSNLFGKSEQERRQEWITERTDLARQGYDRGLRSRSSRFARKRMLSGVDREAALMRSRASGAGSRSRQRLSRALGLAGAGIAEEAQQTAEQAGNVASFDMLTKRLGEFETASSAEALEEAKGRQASYLAGIYAQPLQSPVALNPGNRGIAPIISDVSTFIGGRKYNQQRSNSSSDLASVFGVGSQSQGIIDRRNEMFADNIFG